MLRCKVSSSLRCQVIQCLRAVCSYFSLASILSFNTRNSQYNDNLYTTKLSILVMQDRPANDHDVILASKRSHVTRGYMWCEKPDRNTPEMQ